MEWELGLHQVVRLNVVVMVYREHTCNRDCHLGFPANRGALQGL